VVGANFKYSASGPNLLTNKFTPIHTVKEKLNTIPNANNASLEQAGG
jgi:hypothetical protein